VPRRINLLCGRALLGAWANGLQRVDRNVVDKAAAEVFEAESAHSARTNARRTAYLLGALVLLAMAALGAFLLWPPQQKTLPSRQAAVPAAQALTSAPSRVEPLVLRPLEEIETLLPQFPRDINAAWRELAPIWKLPANLADPCQAASAQQLQCYRVNNLTLPQLHQLDRPGILTLRAGSDPAVYAILVGLDDQSATLRVGQGLHRVRQAALARHWSGDFATYWQTPPGYSADLRDSSTGAAIDRLVRQLNTVDGAPPVSSAGTAQILDATLRERVRAFQRAQGLKPDGQPGPMTFMQLERASGGSGPRLQTAPR
jgi:general secretion pathway protein A